MKAPLTNCGRSPGAGGASEWGAGWRGLLRRWVLVTAGLGWGFAVDSASAQALGARRVSVPDLAGGGVVRVTGNGESDAPRYSRDGRFMVFSSGASDLSTNDLNGFRRDVFVRELATGRTWVASVNPEGRSGNGDSFAPDVSADGRWVAFASRASDLVPGDTNGSVDVFVRDMAEGRMLRASVASNGDEADGDSHAPRLSPDGAVVIFGSRATNLDPAGPDGDGRVDVFLRHLASGTTILVSGEARAGREYDVDDYDVSDDGRWVAFTTISTNVVAATPTRTPMGAYVRDVGNGATLRLETALVPTNLARATVEARSVVFAPGRGRARLAVGTWVTVPPASSFSVLEVVDLGDAGASFIGGAAGTPGTLIDEPTSLSFDASGEALAFTQSTVVSQPAVLRLWRAATGAQTLTNSATGLPVRAREVALSPGGNRVVFSSAATNLVGAGTPPGAHQLYRFELETGTVSLISTNPAGGAVGGMEFARPSFGAAGRCVFQCASDLLVAGDRNRAVDVFEADLESGTRAVVSARVRGGTGAAGGGALPMPGGVSADGRRVLFSSLSDELVPDDAKGLPDLFVRDLVEGRTWLVTVRGAEGGPQRAGFGEAVLSANGRHVAFTGDLLLTRADGSRLWTPQVFVRDLALGRTRTVALNPDGTPASMRTVSQLRISGDGRYVAFFTDATTLVEGSVPRGQAILRDLVAETNALLATAEVGPLRVWLSNLGGRALAVRPGSSPLRAVLWDAVLGERVVYEEAGATSAALSRDGRRVAFAAPGAVGVTPARVWWRDQGGAGFQGAALPTEVSGASGLEIVDVDEYGMGVRTRVGEGPWSTWRIDRASGGVSRVDVLSDVSIGWEHGPSSPSFSADRRRAAFASPVADFAAGDANPALDVFVRELEPGRTQRVARQPDGAWETDGATRPLLSADGRRLVFASWSEAFDTDDGNGVSDVFAVDLDALAPRDHDVDGLEDGWEWAWFGNLSRDGDADDDGDGAAAREEYRNRTSPIDDLQVPTGGLRMGWAADAAGGWRLTWRTQSGRRYRLQATESVTGSEWVAVGDVVVGDGGVAQAGLPISGAGARFFRVSVEP